MKLNKKETKNIAKMLIASTGLAFDHFAFEECYDMIDSEDVDNIILEIQKECMSAITKMSEKMNVCIDFNSTESIIETMYYQP